MGNERLQTIVVATDFSDNASGAVAWAGEIARSHEADLVLAHALYPVSLPAGAPEFVPVPIELQEAERKHAQERLAHQADKTARTFGVSVFSSLVTGEAASAVLDVAAEKKADLILAGTRGQTGLKRAFLGSTAARLVRRAACPVMTVHPDQAGAHRPIRHILVPTDFSGDADRALAAAIRVAGPLAEGARVSLLHVFRRPSEVVIGPWEPVLIQVAKEMEADVRSRLDAVAAPLRDQGLEVEILACEGDPAERIDAEADRLGVDLIAMGTHGRSGMRRLFLGSIAERVLPHAPCPVLSVGAGEEGAS